MKIQHKRSNVLEGGKAKEPTAGQMEYGELAVNYSTTDPAVFIKDSADNIVKIVDTVPPGDGTITIKQPGSPDQSFTVNQDGNTEINLKNDNTQVNPGNGRITIKQPGTSDQSFTVNQTGNTEINLKNDNTQVTPGNGRITIQQPGVSDQTFTVNQAANTEIQVTPGNGALSIASYGSGDSSTGSFTANQTSGSTVTLPQISYTDLKNVPPNAAAPGNGTITITQPGTANQTFTVNQTGNKIIALKNDNTQVTPGNGALTIKTAGQGASATGTFTANQSTGGTITLPTIRYGDLSGRPSIPAAAGNGTITIVQPGTTNQTFTVNQSGNTQITLKNDNTNTTYTGSNGVLLTGRNFTADSSVVRTSGNQSIGGSKTFTSSLTVNGAITASGDVTAFSDISLKENIEVIPDALNKLSQLRGVTYNRKDMEGVRQSGVIAQEVETVLPEVVNTNEDGIKSVAYGNIVGLLIESIKELKAEVETLKEEHN